VLSHRRGDCEWGMIRHPGVSIKVEAGRQNVIRHSQERAKNDEADNKRQRESHDYQINLMTSAHVISKRKQRKFKR
jgi:hypothetical protein